MNRHSEMVTAVHPGRARPRPGWTAGRAGEPRRRWIPTERACPYDSQGQDEGIRSNVRAGVEMLVAGNESRSATLGRTQELDTLAAILDQAVDAGGGAILLHGEPGIGKTRLLGHMRGLAAQRGMRILACSGAPTERNLPFAGLHQLLWPVLPEADRIPPDRLTCCVPLSG